MKYSQSVSAFAALAMSAVTVLAQTTPDYSIPPDLAELLVRGDARVIVVGDSISTNTGGDYLERNHSPWIVGIHRRWRPDAWRGIYVPVGSGVPSGYTNLRGVGGSFYDRPDATESSQQMQVDQAWPGAYDGFATEPSALITFDNPSAFQANLPRFEFRLYPASSPGGSLASAAVLARDQLVVRHLVFAPPGVLTVPSIDLEIRRDQGSLLRLAPTQMLPTSQSGWATLDFDASNLRQLGFDALTQTLAIRPRVAGTPAAGAVYGSDGVLFLDPDQPGMLVASIAQGGWTNDDHLRTTGSGRGYSDDGLRAKLLALGCADPGSTPVIVIATGTNVGARESAGGLTTTVYRDNVAAILARVRAELAAINAGEPYTLLVAMYSWGFPPNEFVTSRADRLWELAQADPRAGFVNLPALTGFRGGTFESTWYFRQPEAFTTAVPAAGAIPVDDASDFPASGQFWATDGAGRWYGSYASRTASELSGVVGMPASLPVGAKILATTNADLHLSRVGAEVVAQAVWDAVTDSLPPCIADWDGSGGVDGDDIPAFFTDWQRGEADPDGSGGVDGDDIVFFFTRWQAGC